MSKGRSQQKDLFFPTPYAMALHVACTLHAGKLARCYAKSHLCIASSPSSNMLATIDLHLNPRVVLLQSCKREHFQHTMVASLVTSMMFKMFFPNVLLHSSPKMWGRPPVEEVNRTLCLACPAPFYPSCEWVIHSFFAATETNSSHCQNSSIASEQGGTEVGRISLISV